MELDFLEKLLKESDTPTETSGNPPPIQNGPLRHYDKGTRCASRGCGSYTYYKVKGIPRCMTHALRELNEMLYELGVER